MSEKAPELQELIQAFQDYAQIRSRFLRLLSVPRSCRDPLAEFSEVLVSRLLGAQRVASRVQKGFDLISPDGKHVQVKSLCNATTPWVNEHHIRFGEGVDLYALVLFEAMGLKTVLVFPRASLAQIGLRLGKRHPRQDSELQLTQKNVHRILQERVFFESLGMRIFDFA